MNSIFEPCVTGGQRLGEGVGVIYKDIRNTTSKMKTFNDNPLAFFPLTGAGDAQGGGGVER